MVSTNHIILLIQKGSLSGPYAYKTEKLVLQHLRELLMDNVSNLTFSNKGSQLLTANKIPMNHVKIGRYIKYLCNAFVFYDSKHYDIRGKKYLENSEKFYLYDIGIRYAIFGTRNMDYGRIYENIVCIELFHRG